MGPKHVLWVAFLVVKIKIQFIDLTTIGDCHITREQVF